MDLTLFEYVIRCLLQPESMARVCALIFCIFWGQLIRDMLHAIFPIPGRRISDNEGHTRPEILATEASVTKKKDLLHECKSEVTTVPRKRSGPALKPDVSIRNYELEQENLKYYKMDLAWTHRTLPKAKIKLQVCANMGIEPKCQISPKDIADKAANDLHPYYIGKHDEGVTELNKSLIGLMVFEDSTPSSNTNNQLAEASTYEVQKAQLNGQVVVTEKSSTVSEQFVRAELHIQERAKYKAKIERLIQERDAARSKLQSSDEICETALLLTSQNKLAVGDASLAKKWAEKELRKKKRAKRAVGTIKLDRLDNAEDLVAPLTKESRKNIPLPISKRVRILINKIPVDMAIDTRCKFSCINKTQWQELGEPKLLTISFNEWSGNQVSRRGLIDVLRGKRIMHKLEWKNMMGYFIARVKIDEKEYGCPLLVFDKPEIPNFMGKSWFQTLELTSVINFQIQKLERLKR